MLNDGQQKAIQILNDRKIKRILLNGGAGVGKTYTIGSYIKDSNEDFVVCAMTNSASKVLQKTLNDDFCVSCSVSTLHKVLKLRPSHNLTTKDGKKLTKFEPTIDSDLFFELKGKTLIIDESSMLCDSIYQYLIKVDCERIIFVGDFYQLKCVDGKSFVFDGVKIELIEVMRSSGDLALYYSSLRKEIDNNVDDLSLFAGAKKFNNKNDFIKYINNFDGSKVVISYTNVLADEYAEMLDDDILFEGQECIVSGTFEVGNRYDRNKKIKIANNEIVLVDKIFRNYSEMLNSAGECGYLDEWYLPNKSRLFENLYDVTYLRVINENDDICYIARWNGKKSDKDEIIAKKINQIGRDLLSDLNSKIPLSLRALKDTTILAQMKSLGLMNKAQEERYSKELWFEHFCFKNAINLRSKVSTTIHKSQGISIDLCAIDLDSSRLAGLDLQYVAFTRAKKEIVYFSRNGEF